MTAHTIGGWPGWPVLAGRSVCVRSWGVGLAGAAGGAARPPRGARGGGGAAWAGVRRVAAAVAGEARPAQEELAGAGGLSPRPVSDLERASTAPPTRTPHCCWPARSAWLCRCGRCSWQRPAAAGRPPTCWRPGGRHDHRLGYGLGGGEERVSCWAHSPMPAPPLGHDPATSAGQRPITDDHRYARPLAGGGCAAPAWTWWAAVKRVDPDIARSQVQTRAGREAAWVIGRRWAGFHPGRTASTLPLPAARHRHTVPCTGRRKAALATSARCHRRRRWPGACRPG